MRDSQLDKTQFDSPIMLINMHESWLSSLDFTLSSSDKGCAHRRSVVTKFGSVRVYFLVKCKQANWTVLSRPCQKLSPHR